MITKNICGDQRLVEGMRKHRRKRDPSFQFLVQSLGYKKQTWEPRTNIPEIFISRYFSRFQDRHTDKTPTVRVRCKNKPPTDQLTYPLQTHLRQFAVLPGRAVKCNPKASVKSSMMLHSSFQLLYQCGLTPTLCTRQRCVLKIAASSVFSSSLFHCAKLSVSSKAGPTNPGYPPWKTQRCDSMTPLDTFTQQPSHLTSCERVRSDSLTPLSTTSTSTHDASSRSERHGSPALVHQVGIRFVWFHLPPQSPIHRSWEDQRLKTAAITGHVRASHTPEGAFRCKSRHRQRNMSQGTTRSPIQLNELYATQMPSHGSFSPFSYEQGATRSADRCVNGIPNKQKCAKQSKSLHIQQMQLAFFNMWLSTVSFDWLLVNFISLAVLHA